MGYLKLRTEAFSLTCSELTIYKVANIPWEEADWPWIAYFLRLPKGKNTPFPTWMCGLGNNADEWVQLTFFFFFFFLPKKRNLPFLMPAARKPLAQTYGNVGTCPNIWSWRNRNIERYVHGTYIVCSEQGNWARNAILQAVITSLWIRTWLNSWATNCWFLIQEWIEQMCVKEDCLARVSKPCSKIHSNI